jgi:HTH-type transcriptional regulator / antitoxin HigA
MKIAPPRSDADYQQMLSRVEQIFDAERGSSEADELEILSLLVERYEEQRFLKAAHSPLDAIRFRMQQARLTPRDLEPLIGSRARVSEILSGHRSLSIDMIRALNRHLGIPAEALLGAPAPSTPTRTPEPATAALNKLRSTGLMQPAEAFQAFVERAFGATAVPALLRKTRTERTNAKSDFAALQGWCAAAMLKSEQVTLPTKRNRARIDLEAARKIAQLSAEPDGPQQARGALAALGVALVFLEHLPGTYLDGAALRRTDNVPVIALTLRYDRVDNFWFTLLHELAHVACHLNSETSVILDDLELRSADTMEDEADRFAQSALIPDEIWSAVSAPGIDASDLISMAQLARIHPAIVAGRWQHEHKDYRRFAKLLQRGKLRALLMS